MNLFVIGTPLQLLNTIELRHAFNLTENHLVIVMDYNHWPKTTVWTRLVCSTEWKTVHYLDLQSTRCEFRSPLVGEHLSRKLSNYRNQYRQYDNKARVDRVARKFLRVDHLVLGNYHGDYMRHFANRVQYRRLCVVDDGTDVLLINQERTRRLQETGSVTSTVSGESAWAKFKKSLRESMLEWDARQANRIEFFTAYDIVARPGDLVVKNEYSYFRKRMTSNGSNGSCMFLGQCLVRDGYISQHVYLDYLRRVRSHFGDQPMLYVPHPREPEVLVNEIREHIGFVIQRVDVPIEWHLMDEGAKPSVLASFFCSALVSCRLIYGTRLKFKAFQIMDEDVIKWPDLVRSAYAYFSTLPTPNIEVVPFSEAHPARSPNSISFGQLTNLLNEK